MTAPDGPQACAALRRELQLLASPAEMQLAYLPDFVVRADELALRFDDAWSFAESRIPADETQREHIARIDDALTRLTTDADHSVWTEASLEQDPRWEAVRALAAAALRVLGWPVEPPPPDDGSRYVR